VYAGLSAPEPASLIIHILVEELGRALSFALKPLRLELRSDWTRQRCVGEIFLLSHRLTFSHHAPLDPLMIDLGRSYVLTPFAHSLSRKSN
jgi:hypothetical protein